jgi:hypothetical protein
MTSFKPFFWRRQDFLSKKSAVTYAAKRRSSTVFVSEISSFLRRFVLHEFLGQTISRHL